MTPLRTPIFTRASRRRRRPMRLAFAVLVTALVLLCIWAVLELAPGIRP